MCLAGRSQLDGKELGGSTGLSKDGPSESITGAQVPKWSFSSSLGGGEGELLLPDLGRKQQLGGKKREGKMGMSRR